MNYIADAKTTFFTDKEHYLAFKKAWSKAVNNSDNHLRAEHFMFYNAIRGLDILNGFTDVTSLKRIFNQVWINLNTYEARSKLNSIAMGRAWGTTIESFVGLFDGTITEEMFRGVISQMPKVEQKMDNSRYRFTSFEDWCGEKAA